VEETRAETKANPKFFLQYGKLDGLARQKELCGGDAMPAHTMIFGMCQNSAGFIHGLRACCVQGMQKHSKNPCADIARHGNGIVIRFNMPAPVLLDYRVLKSASAKKAAAPWSGFHMEMRQPNMNLG